MKINYQLATAILSFATTHLVFSCSADPKPSANPTFLPISLITPIGDLRSDPALQVKVSFEAKDLPLNDLLLILKKISGVNLTLSPDSPALNKRVTAHISELPLADVMVSLNRLYGVNWTKKGDREFMMSASDRGELELALLCIGDLESFKGNFLRSIRLDPTRLDWPKEVANHADIDLLKQSEGQLASVLPTYLLDGIRNEKEKLAGLKLVENQQMAMEASIDSYILRAELPKGRGNAQALTFPRIVVRTAAGRSIATLMMGRPKNPLLDKRDGEVPKTN